MKQQIKIEDIPQDFKSILPPRKRAKTKEEKEQRRIERIMRNRKAARQSRERKRQYMESLENKCNIMKKILDKLDLNKILANNQDLLNNYNDYIINDMELPEKQIDPSSPIDSNNSVNSNTMMNISTPKSSEDENNIINNNQTPISDIDIANLHSPLSSNNSDDNDNNDSLDNSLVDFNFEPKIKLEDLDNNVNNYLTSNSNTNNHSNSINTNILQMQWFQPITPPQVDLIEPTINWEFESNPAVLITT